MSEQNSTITTDLIDDQLTSLLVEEELIALDADPLEFSFEGLNQGVVFSELLTSTSDVSDVPDPQNLTDPEGLDTTLFAPISGQPIFDTVFENTSTDGTTSEEGPVPGPVEDFTITSSGGDFNANLSGFTQEASEAFQSAIDIWDSLIDLNIPVTIDANFQDLGGPNEDGSQPVAGALSNGFVPLLGGGLFDERVFATQAQTNEFLGEDFNGDDAEIVIFFNNAPGFEFFFGTEEAPGDTQIDFVSTVLHEITHGLGLVDTFDVDENGLGSFGLTEDDATPTIFDFFVENGAGEQLIRLDQSSTELGDELTSNNLFLDTTNNDFLDTENPPEPQFEGVELAGGNATEAFAGARPQLFAPTTFQPGSSIAHLDETAFNPGSGNELLTPGAFPGEFPRDPGPIALGLIEDLGFTLEEPLGQSDYEALLAAGSPL